MSWRQNDDMWNHFETAPERYRRQTSSSCHIFGCITFFKMVAVDSLEVLKFAFGATWLRLCRHHTLLPCAKFSWNCTIGWWFTAKKLNMAAVHHLEFVVTSLYCTREEIFTIQTLSSIFTLIGVVVSEIPEIPCFCILARVRLTTMVCTRACQNFPHICGCMFPWG